MDENKSVAGYRVGNKVYVFDEVDISTIVERKSADGFFAPATLILRRANYKTYKEISDEIRAAQNSKLSGNALGESAEAKKANLLSKLPKFLRNIVFWKLRNDAKFKKDMIGQVSVSSVGMFAKNATGWPVATSFWGLELDVGSICESHCHEGDKIIPLELLNATMVIDHDVVDGGPATRFLVKFKELIESGFPIEELLT